ncbi:hypothetical protein EYF80_036773 [Liparis tanakae]|uniref:Uncharacterized protein n=1 Tax=Liparis tanakae TaxID=230148 RepID=A0A4Z2GJV8_9TELE|nr:hypothetical protein EYF80_036773 [Liparis tanakae]
MGSFSGLLPLYRALEHSIGPWRSAVSELSAEMWRNVLAPAVCRRARVLTLLHRADSRRLARFSTHVFLQAFAI